MKIESAGITTEMAGRAAMSAVRAVGKKSPENDSMGKEYSRRRDMYISAEEENAGIYEQVSEEGRAVVRFKPMEDNSPEPDDGYSPKPSDKKAPPEMKDKDDLPEKDSGSPGRSKDGQKPEDSKKSESCTGSTDKVDREIKALREKLQKLKEQAAKAEGRKKKELESKISTLEKELAMKDNDSYRRQHTEFH